MQVYFTVNVGRKFGTSAGVHLIEGLCLLWGLFNKGSTLSGLNVMSWPGNNFVHGKESCPFTATT